MRSWIVFNLPLLFIAALIGIALMASALSPLAGALTVVIGTQCYIPLKKALLDEGEPGHPTHFVAGEHFHRNRQGLS